MPFARSVASYVLVSRLRGLETDRQELGLRIETVGRTVIIGVAGNIEWGMAERRDGHCFIFGLAFQRPLPVTLWFPDGLLP